MSKINIILNIYVPMSLNQVSDFILNMHFHLSMANIYASYEGGERGKTKKIMSEAYNIVAFLSVPCSSTLYIAQIVVKSRR